MSTLDFANLFDCIQHIKEPTHNLGNYLDLLFTDVTSVLDPPLGNSDHSSITFSMKLSFKIHNISFSCKVYLIEVICRLAHVGNDLFNCNWSVVYNTPN